MVSPHHGVTAHRLFPGPSPVRKCLSLHLLRGGPPTLTDLGRWSAPGAHQFALEKVFPGGSLLRGVRRSSPLQENVCISQAPLPSPRLEEPGFTRLSQASIRARRSLSLRTCSRGVRGGSESISSGDSPRLRGDAGPLLKLSSLWRLTSGSRP